jgi:hypothetical protein
MCKALFTREARFNKKGKPMVEQHTHIWEPGPSSAPLPPLVDLPGFAHGEQPLFALYRTYGPVFRLPQPEQRSQIILAGPEINVFLARHEDAFFTTREQWEQFDTMISQHWNLAMMWRLP